MMEVTCKLGARQQLAGIVTEAAGRRGFVLISAGLLPKFGPYRLYTQLARRLATAGITTLRFDLSSIGDSGHEHRAALEARTGLEIRAAVDHLMATYRLDSVVVGGLCSGAEDAFRYAEHDPRVAGAVLIDPFAYRTRGWHVRNLGYRVVRRVLRAAGVYEPHAIDTTGRLVKYRYLEHADSSRILRAMLARRGHVHFVYTGGARSSFNHRGQLAAMFPEIPLGDRVSLDHFPRMDHTQLLEEDRRRVVDSIATRLERW